MQRLALRTAARCKLPRKAAAASHVQRRFYLSGNCEKNPLNPEPGYASENSSASTLPVPVFRQDVVYANPICSQMDQLLLQAGDYATVLDLLVTHRGVFFIHNLVTAIQMLAHISSHHTYKEASQQLSLSKRPLMFKDLTRDEHPEIVKNDLLNDDRFDLLLRDLRRFAKKMDHLAIRDVLQALRALDHKYFLIFRAVYRPLMDLPLPEVQTMIEITDAFRWAGYCSHPFFDRCSQELAVIEQLPKEDLVKLATVYGALDKYRPALFANMQKLILEVDPDEFTGKELTAFATAFSKHFTTNHDQVFALVLNRLTTKPTDFNLKQAVTCLASCRRIALNCSDAVRAVVPLVKKPLLKSYNIRQRFGGMQTPHVAGFLETAAFFGVELGQDEDVLKVAYDYLEDYVNDINERDAIRVVYSMCVYSERIEHHDYFLELLWRKMGVGTYWETAKEKTFMLWLSHMLQFPFVERDLPKPIVQECFREWAIARRGCGSAYREEVEEISAELEEMGVEHMSFVDTEGPYQLDLVCRQSPHAAIIVTTELCRHLTDFDRYDHRKKVIGNTLLQFRHLEDHYNVQCVPLCRNSWRSFGKDERRAYLRSILEQLPQEMELAE